MNHFFMNIVVAVHLDLLSSFLVKVIAKLFLVRDSLLLAIHHLVKINL